MTRLNITLLVMLVLWLIATTSVGPATTALLEIAIVAYLIVYAGLALRRRTKGAR